MSDAQEMQTTVTTSGYHNRTVCIDRHDHDGSLFNRQLTGRVEKVLLKSIVQTLNLATAYRMAEAIA